MERLPTYSLFPKDDGMKYIQVEFDFNYSFDGWRFRNQKEETLSEENGILSVKKDLTHRLVFDFF